MSLVRFDAVTLDYGEQVLLRGANLVIEPGERLCLIGRNGAGKSSLLALITGGLEPDGGSIHVRPGLRIAHLEQGLPPGDGRSVFEVVASGLDDLRRLIDDYERRAAQALDAAGLRELEQLQHRIDSQGGWQLDRQVETVIAELSLPADRPFGELSGGWRRRMLLGRVLVARPDLLLLDEPTNHLDLGTILWLEARMRDFEGSLLFISHDRAFIQSLATRIIEIDRGRLTSWPGSFAAYRRLKEKALVDEASENERFDKKLALEEVWIREGIKARRTRNEGRVRALVALRAQRARRLEVEGKARLRIDPGDASGRQVIVAREVGHGYGDRVLFQGLSLTVQRGDRVGIIGNNGVGKSTLLAILLGKLTPRGGEIRHGSHLEVAYFDQLRTSLDPDKTVAENVAPGREHIKVAGADVHVISYMSGFLFSASRTRTPVSALSGGERNRVILAQLFARPANLLVLDEPTDDLDIETLEVLEARLTDYAGTILLVSHDREFLDNVVTSTLVFESDGVIREYPGGYRDWERRGRSLAGTQATEPSAPPPRTRSEAKPRSQSKKLGYHQQRELDELPGRIETLEGEIQSLEARTAAPGFYEQGYERVQPVLAELADAQARLERAMGRWAELEQLSEALKGG